MNYIPIKRSTTRQVLKDTSPQKSIKNQQYYQAQTQPTKSIKNKSNRRLNQISFLIIGAILTAVFIYNLMLDPTPNLNINSEVFRPKNEYINSASSLMGGLFNKNKLTINTQSITEELKKQYPEISEVSINSAIIGPAVDIQIKVIEPKLILKNSKDIFVIDEKGRAVAKNTTADISKIPVINDQTSFKVDLGKQALTQQQVQFMEYLISQSKGRSINIKELVLPSGSAGELFMYLGDKPYFVKFLMDGSSADVQLGTYIALMNELDKQGKQLTEYIDVRVEGKAFVK